MNREDAMLELGLLYKEASEKKEESQFHETNLVGDRFAPMISREFDGLKGGLAAAPVGAALGAAGAEIGTRLSGKAMAAWNAKYGIPKKETLRMIQDGISNPKIKKARLIAGAAIGAANAYQFGSGVNKAIGASNKLDKLYMKNLGIKPTEDEYVTAAGISPDSKQFRSSQALRGLFYTPEAMVKSKMRVGDKQSFDGKFDTKHHIKEAAEALFMEKIAAREPTNEETVATLADLGAIGAGGALAKKQWDRGNVNGRETLYHNTKNENVLKIEREGLLSSKSNEPDSFTRKVLPDIDGAKLDNKVYLARKKILADGVGNRAHQVEHGKIFLDPEGAKRERMTLKGRFPTWMMNEVDNPELRGFKKPSEYIDYFEKLKGKPLDKMERREANFAFNLLGRKGTAVIEGDVAGEYFKGSGYKGATAKEVANFIKANPKRFAKGIGAAAAGVGLAGAGAVNMHKINERVKKEASLELELMYKEASAWKKNIGHLSEESREKLVNSGILNYRKEIDGLEKGTENIVKGMGAQHIDATKRKGVRQGMKNLMNLPSTKKALNDQADSLTGNTSAKKIIKAITGHASKSATKTMSKLNRGFMAAANYDAKTLKVDPNSTVFKSDVAKKKKPAITSWLIDKIQPQMGIKGANESMDSMRNMARKNKDDRDYLNAILNRHEADELRAGAKQAKKTVKQYNKAYNGDKSWKDEAGVIAAAPAFYSHVSPSVLMRESENVAASPKHIREAMSELRGKKRSDIIYSESKALKSWIKNEKGSAFEYGKDRYHNGKQMF